MFTPEQMEQIQVVFSETDIEPVSEAVVRHGALHLMEPAEMESWQRELLRSDPGQGRSEQRALRERVEGLLKTLECDTEPETAEPAEGSWNDLDSRVDKIEKEVRAFDTEHRRLSDELTRLDELKRRVRDVPDLELPLKQAEKASYLVVEYGRIFPEPFDGLENKLKSVMHILYPVGTEERMKTVLVIGLAKDRDRIRSILAESGFQSIPVSETSSRMPPELIGEIDQKTDRIRESFEKSRKQCENLAREHGPFLRSVLGRIQQEALKNAVRNKVRRTERTCLLSGWIPAEEETEFRKIISRATKDRCIIEAIPAEEIPSVRSGEVQVPVQLKNPPFFRPFELITSAYGMPSYRTIDPTPILGVSFLLIFGMMFGDVGHGLVLALLGLLLGWKGRRNTQRSAGLLVFYAGISSMVFGFLFGSFFGIEHWLPTLWVKPMESINQLFTTTLYFGIGMIFLSIAVNMINGWKQRDFLGMLFDKAGLLAAIVYWCSIVIVTRLILSRSGGEVHVLIFILLIVSVVLLFLKEPIVQLLRGRRKLFPEGMATGIMGGIVEILEIFLGFLANTVSFIRVAAFVLAHAGLFMAVFALSEAVQGVAGGVLSVFILIVGNMLIILLEGLIVSIQAVRLEFYEFFSRFFQQSEAGYRPLKAGGKP